MAKQFSGAGHLNVPHSAQYGGDKAARGFEVGEGKQRRTLFPEHIPAAIVRALSQLERIQFDRPHQIFEYWLDVQLAYYHAQPLICAYGHKYKEFPDQDIQHWIDSRWPEQAEKLARIKHHYGDRANEAFGHYWDAFHLMTRIAELQVVGDWLGGVYAEWELHNHWRGQYFSPWSICSMMAQMLAGDWKSLVTNVMFKAVDAAGINIPGTPWHMAAEDAPERVETLKWLLDTNAPAILPHIQPVRVLEPCSGSGAMLMALMGTVEPWIFNYDLIRLHGIDIDPICAKMTQLQLLLYGVNGYEHLTLAGLRGQINIDDPESITRYEAAFQHVLGHVECRNALEFTPAERAAWERDMARQKAADAELAAQNPPPAAPGKPPKVARGKPKVSEVPEVAQAAPEPPAAEQPTLAAEFAALATKPKEKKAPKSRLATRGEFVIIERQSSLFDDE